MKKDKDMPLDFNIILSELLHDIDTHIRHIDEVKRNCHFTMGREQGIQFQVVRSAFVEARKGIVALIGLTLLPKE